MSTTTHHSVPKTERKWYGYRRDQRDPRDRFFSAAVDLPATVDLRGDCPPVLDQGQLGSCTAHGITEALRFHLVKKGGPRDHTLSRLQLYYDERAIEGSVSDDSGAEIRDGIKCAAKIGVAHEGLWPYRITKFRNRPPASVYRDAQKFTAISYERVEVGTQALKQAMASGVPVIVGFAVFDSFESAAVARTGMVPMPDLAREQMLGGHCTLVVGYGQKPGTFTVRNSWAADWGDRGDCYMPEDYLGSSKFGGDYWVIRSIG
jgi:C1A family cysteine protease